MIRAVLDTNVIASSFLSPYGIPKRIVMAWKDNLFELCLSNPLYDEISQVLSRPAIGRLTRVGQIESFLAYLANKSIYVKGPLTLEPVIADDPADDVILATALATQADVIVSGDHHLLNLGEYRGIPILSPRAFLEIL